MAGVDAKQVWRGHWRRCGASIWDYATARYCRRQKQVTARLEGHPTQSNLRKRVRKSRPNLSVGQFRTPFPNSIGWTRPREFPTRGKGRTGYNDQIRYPLPKSSQGRFTWPRVENLTREFLKLVVHVRRIERDLLVPSSEAPVRIDCGNPFAKSIVLCSRFAHILAPKPLTVNFRPARYRVMRGLIVGEAVVTLVTPEYSFRLPLASLTKTR